MEKLENSAEVTQTASRNAPPPKKTFIQSLAIFTGTHSKENLIPLLVAPLAVNLNLGALWMVVVTGMLSSFYVSQSFVAAQIFAFPPYLLNAAGVGYMFVGPFLGGLIGSIVLVGEASPNRELSLAYPQTRHSSWTLSSSGAPSAIEAFMSQSSASFLPSLGW